MIRRTRYRTVEIQVPFTFWRPLGWHGIEKAPWTRRGWFDKNKGHLLTWEKVLGVSMMREYNRVLDEVVASDAVQALWLPK